MDVTAARKALAAAARTLSTPDFPLQCLESPLGSISPPTFYPGGVEVDYYPPQGRPLILFTFGCKLLLGRAEDRAAHQRIDAYLSGGDRNLRRALEADETLGGLAAGLVVLRTDDYGLHDVGGQQYWGVDVPVNVWSTDD